MAQVLAEQFYTTKSNTNYSSTFQAIRALAKVPISFEMDSILSHNKPFTKMDLDKAIEEVGNSSSGAKQHLK